MSTDAREPDARSGRREFLRSGIMWLGLGAGYAVGIRHFLKYLVPMGRKLREREMFVGPVDALRVGQSRVLRTPDGQSYVMARIGEPAASASFRVLSDVCPHLGCRVHWEPENDRLVCPCHSGVFDPSGKAIGGPPAEAGQNLAELRTRVRGHSVFVILEERA